MLSFTFLINRVQDGLQDLPVSLGKIHHNIRERSIDSPGGDFDPDWRGWSTLDLDVPCHGGRSISPIHNSTGYTP